MKIFLSILYCLLFISCQSHQANQTSVEIVKYPFHSTISSLSELIESIEAIPLDTNSNFVLGFMPHTLHRDSSYYIGDMIHSKIIYRFSENGHFLNTIGVCGKGPGEYLNLNDFYVDDTTNDVYTISSPDLRLYHFDKEGHFKGMKAQVYNPGSFIKNKNAFWVYGGNNNGYMPEQIIQLDSNFNITRKIFPLDTKAIHVSLGPVFSQWKDQIYLVMGLDPQIYQMGQDSLFPVIRFDFGHSNIPASYWETKNPMQAVMDLQNNGFCNINNFLVNDKYIICEQNEQRGSNNRQVWYVCSIKHRESKKWDWVRKEIREGGMAVNSQETGTTDSKPEWYMKKIQGFAKDGRLMVLADGTALESMSTEEKALISNPQVLANIDPETTTVLFLCTLK